jgi:rRNA maturation protein Nop10
MKNWICSECGERLKTGRSTGGTSTWHAGKCDYCGKKQYVTEPRDFGIDNGSKKISEVEALFGILGIKK